MKQRLEYMKQPNGATICIYMDVETLSCYTDEELENGFRNTFLADVYVSWPYGSVHCPYHFMNKRFYSDKLGIYTYKKQKNPIYYWKPKDIKTDYDNWENIPLNEPRKLKKNYF